MTDKKKKGRQVKADEVWVAARIPRTTKERLAAWAKKTGASESLIIRRLVLEALDAGRDAKGEIP